MNRPSLLPILFVISILVLPISLGYSQKETAKSLLNKLKAELDIAPEIAPKPKLTDALPNIKPPTPAVTIPASKNIGSRRSINNAPWRWSSSRRPKLVKPETKTLAAMTLTRSNKNNDLYTVRQGDTMASIARKYGTTEARLRALNSVYRTGNPITGQVVQVRGEITASAIAEAEADQGPRLPTGADGLQVYTIQSGDNPSRIATKFNVSLKELMSLNKISNPRLLKIGQKLRIPEKKQKVEPAFDAEGHDVHVVATGDTLWTIAQQHGVEYYTLIGLNSITNPTGLKIGQKLKIPEKK